MTQKDSYKEAFDKLGSFVMELYEDGDPNSLELLQNEEASPLYEALSNVSERYQEAQLIGKGGMKEVYKVYDLRAARYVALAKPRKELTRADYDAFLREAHITARLAHPGIINLYNIGIDNDQRPFFTMEFKRGRSLREILKDLNSEKDLISAPIQKRLNIFLRVCEAIAYAHSRRVLHLDIKPENIQVGTLGEVQVCDWGLGVVLTAEEGEAQDSHVFDDSEITLDPDLYGPLLIRASGTLAYMAPEQTKAREAKTKAMDIYSLGCVLEELITLKFSEAQKISNDINDNVLNAIVTKARHRNPKKRYESVESLHQDIARYLNGYSTTVEKAGFIREASLFYKRNRIPCLITISLLGLLFVCTLLFIGQLEESRSQAQNALQKYLDEKDASKQQLIKNADEALYLARRMSEPIYMGETVFKEALSESERQLKHVVAQNPPMDSISWGKLIWIQFIKQDFKSALEVLEKNPKPKNVNALVPYIKQYAHLVNDKGYFPIDTLTLILKKCYNGGKEQPKSLVEKIAFYDIYHERSTEDYVKLIKTLLELKNSTCEKVTLLYDEQTKTVTVKGKNLKRLSFRKSPKFYNGSYLKILDPFKVILVGTDVRDMTELKNLSLHELDLRGIDKIYHLPYLNKMRSLRKIIINKGQFSTEQKENLADFIEIEEREVFSQ